MLGKKVPGEPGTAFRQLLTVIGLSWDYLEATSNLLKIFRTLLLISSSVNLA